MSFLSRDELLLSDFPEYQHSTLLNSVFRDSSCDLPLDVFTSLKPVVQAIGLSAFTYSHHYLQVYRQVNKRLLQLREYERNLQRYSDKYVAGGGVFSEMLEDDSLHELNSDLQGHISFVNTVASLLDTYNTIDHASGLSYDSNLIAKEVCIEWRKYISEFPARDLHCKYLMEPKIPMPKDKAAIQLIRGQLEGRRALYIQRLKNAVTLADSRGWYVVFDTLTLENSGINRFYNDPNAIRDYTREFGRRVNEGMGRPKRASYSDVYHYFCVPEYGSLNGRLHFHIIHLCKVLPLGSCDPNHGLKNPVRREIASFRGLWSYGFSKPIAVRYKGDRFGRDGWRHPNDSKTNKPIDLKPVMAVCNYVAKYVAKQTDYKICAKIRRSKEQWNQTTMERQVESREFRVRMSRGFGMGQPSTETMENLSLSTLLELSKLHFKVTPIHKILSVNCKRELVKRLGILTIAQLQEVMPETVNLLKSLRLSMQSQLTSKQLSFISIMTQKLGLMDISREAQEYIEIVNGRFPKSRFSVTLGSK
jgi:hypothetical protein